MVRLPFALVLFLLLPTTLFANTWHILPDGTGDAPTIQAGIDSAASGDVIELAEGVFRGDGNRDIGLMGKSLWIRSATGDPAGCIIDCEGSIPNKHRGLTILLEEAPGTVLDGFTIRNGLHGANGGGVWCNGPVTIEGCAFEDNYSYGYGGGLYLHSGSPLVEGCRFQCNRSDRGGGGIYLGGSPTVRDCTFDRNRGLSGGGIGSGECDFTVEGCAFVRNSSFNDGGAVSASGAGNKEISFCTFFADSAGDRAGGIDCTTRTGQLSLECDACTFFRCTSHLLNSGTIRASQNCTVGLTNCVIASTIRGAGVACLGGVFALSCTDVFGNEGGDWTACIADQYGVNGNFSADPLFCNAEGGDFTLRSDSPCLPGHHPAGYDCGLIGVFGEGCSGPSAVEHTSWGGVKRMFR